jgi:uncharacterized membrane protein
MSEVVPPPLTNKRFLSQSGIALTVYILYLLGFLTGITAVLGVVVAHVSERTADPDVGSHLRFQVRTFWIGVAYFTLGWLLSYLLVGFPLLIWWFVWTLIRVVRGMLLLNDGKPIPNPKSFLLGGPES